MQLRLQKRHNSFTVLSHSQQQQYLLRTDNMLSWANYTKHRIFFFFKKKKKREYHSRGGRLGIKPRGWGILSMGSTTEIHTQFKAIHFSI